MPLWVILGKSLNNDEFLKQLCFSFDMCRVGNNALGDRTNGLTGWLVVVSFAFRTEVGINFKDLLSHRNRTIRTLRVTHVAVNAFIRDEQCHNYLPVGLRVS